MKSTHEPKASLFEGRGMPVAYPAKQERDVICAANDGGSEQRMYHINCNLCAESKRVRTPSVSFADSSL